MLVILLLLGDDVASMLVVLPDFIKTVQVHVLNLLTEYLGVLTSSKDSYVFDHC